ncbi:DUF1565 domain-containing protein [Euhalothece natronophila Z-M001]|uniref:DUF1565 domain-containing protein n=1 Tax=Euhalothece natronophila Z-M001 TaxID=522448 RepID=A0A5B8NN38_9CHRO|nr:DUF1565 domain-containing protein [Euhalothece natronophila]QDZ40377.1 DUF1565 domain-containing protein [Euhalothece natronophila Z-M001]
MKLSRQPMMRNLLLISLIAIMQSSCTLLFHSSESDRESDIATSPEEDSSITDEEDDSSRSSPNSEVSESEKTSEDEEGGFSLNRDTNPSDKKNNQSESGKDGRSEATNESEKKGDLFVTVSGDDHNSGSIRQPLRTLTEAIEKATEMQEEKRDQEVVIKLDRGTYSERSGEDKDIKIPSDISIVGTGDNTIVLANLELSSNVLLQDLQVKDHKVTVGEEITEGKTVLKNLFVNDGGVEIASSNVQLSDINLKGASREDVLLIASENPRLNNIKIENRYQNPVNSSYSSLGSLIIGSEASPQITNLKIQNSLLGINNEGNSAIKNLELVGNRAGIYNEGEITLEEVTISKAEKSHYGICNQDEGTVLIETAKLDSSSITEADDCTNFSGNSYPDTIPDLAGNYESIFIENLD